MVSYDDAQSYGESILLANDGGDRLIDIIIAAKGHFIQQSGLLGFAMWEAAGDYEDILLDAISDGIGIGENSC